MKRFPYPLPLVALLCIFLFCCSNDGFEKPKGLDLPDGLDITATEIHVECIVEKEDSKSCYKISKNACVIIGGREKDSTETCISIDCGWTSKEVKYGQRSTLHFKSNNLDQETCSTKISYGNGDKQLDTVEYTISKDEFPDLPYNKDTNIVAKATVTCNDLLPIVQYCKPLKVISVPIEFACEWTPKEVKFGQKSTLSFNFKSYNVDQDSCTKVISYKDEPLSIGENNISTNISGLSYDKDATITATATVTCKGDVLPKVDCSDLKVNSVPVDISGDFSFKKSDYTRNDSIFFFIGTKVDTSYIKNTMKITNKDDAECGDVRIKIDGKLNGNTTAKLGTPIKATAVVYCKYTDTLEIASITATVLPDPAIGNCELAGNSKTTMRTTDTLKVGISVDNSYGRCNKIEYSFNNGTTYSSSSSFVLKDPGNMTARAKVTCSGKDTTVTCPTVSVANYIKWDGCKEANRDKRDQLTFRSGKTIVDFACDTSKEDYYISCDTSPRTNFSIEIDGYKEGDSANDIRPNGGDSGYNFPNLEPIKDGNLYRYPISVTVNNKTSGDLKCGIW